MSPVSVVSHVPPNPTVVNFWSQHPFQEDSNPQSGQVLQVSPLKRISKQAQRFNPQKGACILKSCCNYTVSFDQSFKDSILDFAGIGFSFLLHMTEASLMPCLISPLFLG